MLPSVQSKYRSIQQSIREQIGNVLTQTCHNHVQQTASNENPTFSKETIIRFLQEFYKRNPYLEETSQLPSSCEEPLSSQLFTQLFTEIMNDIDLLYQTLYTHSPSLSHQNHYHLHYFIDVLFLTLLSMKYYYLDKSIHNEFVVNIPPSRISMLVDRGYNLFKDNLIGLCTGI